MRPSPVRMIADCLWIGRFEKDLSRSLRRKRPGPGQSLGRRNSTTGLMTSGAGHMRSCAAKVAHHETGKNGQTTG